MDKKQQLLDRLDFMQGYTRSIESAQAILEFLERHFDVNASIRNQILELCETPSH